MRKRTPQEKKQLSYEHDRRNAYGEHDKGSRKTIPRHKREVVRAYRRATKRPLPKNQPTIDRDAAEAAEQRVLGVRRKAWRKFADVPLREYIELQKESRRSLRRTRGTGIDLSARRPK